MGEKITKSLILFLFRAYSTLLDILRLQKLTIDSRFLNITVLLSSKFSIPDFFFSLVFLTCILFLHLLYGLSHSFFEPSKHDCKLNSMELLLNFPAGMKPINITDRDEIKHRLTYLSLLVEPMELWSYL